MSKFKRFISGVTETGEKAKEKRFKTRYYRVEQKKAINEIVNYAKREKDLSLQHVSENRGEIMVEYQSPIGLKYDLVLTIFPVTPVQSAVDMHAAVRARIVDLGFNGKLIDRVYNHLDKQFTKVN